MAHRGHHPIEGSRSETKIIYGQMRLGNGAAQATGHDGDVVSSNRTGVGVHTLVFRHKYPQGVFPDVKVLTGSTVGLQAELSAWDPAAGTATLQLTDAGVAADGNVNDVVYFALHVRNSNYN